MTPQIQLIKQVSLQFLPASVVLLFGSRARNDYETDSDYDFLIITQEKLSVEKKRNYKAKIC